MKKNGESAHYGFFKLDFLYRIAKDQSIIKYNSLFKKLQVIQMGVNGFYRQSLER